MQKLHTWPVFFVVIGGFLIHKYKNSSRSKVKVKVIVIPLPSTANVPTIIFMKLNNQSKQIYTVPDMQQGKNVQGK